MKLVKKALVTATGLLLLLIGVVFIILPGPAVLIIPLALGVLAIEYPIAKKWLRVFQKKMKQSAEWADRRWRAFKMKS
ncbi:PGPGW domain-containing protein [Pleionea sediminis]|uniref:PGPGW domain-containing protein n=1 Tax=Pleionea sediminis TaxID=2569479 RepID=UPI001184779B|nr:PGPGW domain-containing protein [Pleionea sediminis]